MPYKSAVGRPSDAFMEAVYTVTRLIPVGRVATYSQVATYVSTPRHARAVGSALRHLPEERSHLVPWQRVINAGGRISERGDGQKLFTQKQMLANEGIVFDRLNRINLVLFGWEGPPVDWVPPFSYPLLSRKRT